MSNCLDPYQDRRSVGSDLGLNCLQRWFVENLSVLILYVTVNNFQVMSEIGLPGSNQR